MIVTIRTNDAGWLHLLEIVKDLQVLSTDPTLRQVVFDGTLDQAFEIQQQVEGPDFTGAVRILLGCNNASSDPHSGV